jgi:tetratricopeptide (TPR) repeat protein
MNVFRIFIILFSFVFMKPAAYPLRAANQIMAIVFPLDSPLKESALGWLSEGIALSISNQIDGRELKSMDHSERIRIVESLDLPPGARLSRGSMIRVAQRADADLVILGGYSGTERNLRVAIRVLDVKGLKLSGEMVANGPIAALPQMENELAWLILRNNGLENSLTREKFQERTRKIPNAAYAYYIQSLTSSGGTNQLQPLLKAVQLYRDFPEAQFRLGHLYFHQGDCASAIPHLLLGISDISAQMESDFMRGTCYILGDQPLQAVQALGRLQTSGSLEALNNLGVAYLRKGDLTAALSVLLDAKSIARNDATVSLNLALVRHLLGNDSAARNILEDSIKTHPLNGMIHFLLSVVLKTQGESDKLATAIAKAKSLGLNVDKLQSEDPKTWSRVMSNFESR